MSEAKPENRSIHIAPTEKARAQEEVQHPEDGHSPEGRSQSFNRLFREHNRSLMSFLVARLRSVHEARDVAQEAYVRLLQLDKPGAVSLLRSYLFRTAA